MANASRAWSWLNTIQADSRSMDAARLETGLAPGDGLRRAKGRGGLLISPDPLQDTPGFQQAVAFSHTAPLLTAQADFPAEVGQRVRVALGRQFRLAQSLVKQGLLALVALAFGNFQFFPENGAQRAHPPSHG